MNKDMEYNLFMRNLYRLLDNGVITESELDKKGKNIVINININGGMCE